jgi:DivIVA domain-containing protein
MPLTPEQITNHRFGVVLRGLDPNQVKAFLSRVAADYTEVLEQASSTPPSTDPFDQSHLDPYQQLGDEVDAVLRAAKQTADEIERRAHDQVGSEVGAILRAARDAADELRRRAREEAQALQLNATQEAMQTRRKEQEEASVAVEAARQRAERMVQEAEAYARELKKKADTRFDSARENTERMVREAERRSDEMQRSAQQQSKKLLDEASQRYRRLQEHERDLKTRVEQVESTLQGLHGALNERGSSDQARRSRSEAIASRASSSGRVVHLRPDDSERNA